MSREHHSHPTARLASNMGSHVENLFLNSLNSFVCFHFSRPRSGNASGTERFDAGSPEAISTKSNGPHLGSLPSMDRAHSHTSHAESCGASAVSKITLSRLGGSPLPSVTLTATPVWVDACRTLSRAFIHAMLLALCTHSDTHTGVLCYYKRYRGLHSPKTRHVLFRIMRPLHLAQTYWTHLVAVWFEGAYGLPLFLKEVILTLTSGLKTLNKLNRNILHLFFYLRLLLFM